MEIVVVERRFEQSYTIEQVGEVHANASSCLDLYNIEYLHGFLSADGKRMLCIYRAPDAEAVRASSRTAGVPWERAWRAEVTQADET